MHSLTTPTHNTRSALAIPLKYRREVQSEEATIFTDIYQEETNIAIWQRKLSEQLQHSVEAFVAANPRFQTAMAVTPQNVLESTKQLLGETNKNSLSEDIAKLVDMFCYLFDLKRAGLRLTVLNQAMCPRFHVDKVPCRLITTYQGVATQWLPQSLVNREKLGKGNNGQTDEQSGLFQDKHDIQQLQCGHVALLKGELWQDNEHAGIVHRSPATPPKQSRLLLTLDFIN